MNAAGKISAHPLMVTPRIIAAGGALLMSASGLVLIIAYGAICWRHGTAWPWSSVVHEDGFRTLIGSLLFYAHAARELPIDLILGAGVGGAAFFTFPLSNRNPGDVMTTPILALALFVVCGIILVGSVVTEGVDGTLANLMQEPTRPGAALVWGAHWRYHLLERGPLIIFALGAGALLRVLTGQVRGSWQDPGLRVTLGALAIFAALTMVFTPNLADLALPFVDPRYLGHEVREIFTHVLVTMPVTWGALLLLNRCALPVPGPLALPADRRRLLLPLALMFGFSTCWAYMVIAGIAFGSVEAGQSADTVTLLAPHFFEHGFSYLVTPLTAALAYSLIVGSRR